MKERTDFSFGGCIRGTQPPGGQEMPRPVKGKGMLQIAIVEDDPSERERIRECLRLMEDDDISFAVREFETGVSFLDQYQPEYDIVLMDIEMPGIDGLKTARELRRMDGEVILIFVTNMAQFALYGYEVDALDFILKPINRYSFSLKRRGRAGSGAIEVLPCAVLCQAQLPRICETHKGRGGGGSAL